MSAFFDALETRDPQQRLDDWRRALPAQIAHAQAHSAAFAALLQGVDAAQITSPQALAQLPVTRKSDLLARQQAQRQSDPFGGFSALVRGPKLQRIFASPGPIYEPEGVARDYWRTARALHAAGFRSGDLVHNAFSYHMTPGAFILESGALALGCSVFPAGTGQTEQQLQAIVDLHPDAYVGTPSFLRILVEKAQATGADISSIRKALVGGEAFPPTLQQWLAQRGIDAYQSYATADVGLIAYETAARDGLVIDEGVVVEIVRPGTGDPVAAGEVGEVVVTTLNPDYPLIRFGTGDLSAILPGPCPSGRTNQRIRGWLGRADQTTKVRGMFVHPGQVAQIVKAHPQIKQARLVVSGAMANDQLTLRVAGVDLDEQILAAVAATVREVTKLRAEVVAVSNADLPNDGKVIEDARSYS